MAFSKNFFYPDMNSGCPKYADFYFTASTSIGMETSHGPPHCLALSLHADSSCSVGLSQGGMTNGLTFEMEMSYRLSELAGLPYLARDMEKKEGCFMCDSYSKKLPFF